MIRIRQVNVNVLNDSKGELIKNCAKKLKIKETAIKDIFIIKQSLDARKKPDLFYSYEVDVKVENENSIFWNKSFQCRNFKGFS